jgi:hypothetical protein
LKVLLLGTNASGTSTAYLRFGLEASTLVDSVDQEYVVGHTARQEFTTDADLEKVLSSADQVFWTDPPPMEFGNLETYYDFLEWLKYYQNKYKNIVNFSEITLDPYNWKLRLPTLTDDDAVFLGCSFTQGIGLSDQRTHWATQVADHFGKKCINLGTGGASNAHAFEILSSLNLQPGQIIVWQITALERIKYCFEDRKLQHIMFANTNSNIIKELLTVYHHDYLLFELLTKIRFFIKLTQALKLRSAFWLMDYKNKDMYSPEDQLYFYEYPQYIPAYKMQNYIVDYGDDNMHPGIDSNKNISQVVIKHLEQLYENQQN